MISAGLVFRGSLVSKMVEKVAVEDSGGIGLLRCKGLCCAKKELSCMSVVVSQAIVNSSRGVCYLCHVYAS